MRRYAVLMDRVVIPGRATYARVALSDLSLGAPLVSRLLLGATGPGQVVAAASAGYYAGSALRDWWARRGVRPIDFRATYGADIDHLTPQPAEARVWEIRRLGHLLNEAYVEDEPDIELLAEVINQLLTDYVASITGQEVVTSHQVRSVTLARFLMPMALGSCDPISGDIAVFRSIFPITPHILAHELCHRKGYLMELHAQALAFLALRTSSDPVLIQAARAERLHRQLKVHQRLSDEPLEPEELVQLAGLRAELRAVFAGFLPDASEADRRGVMARLYDQRMKLTGQNGISDYDEGFLNFLWTFTHSEEAQVPKAHAAL